MKLIIAEKGDAAKQIARLLSTSGAPKADKVYQTPVYRFNFNGDECVTIGLRGHILEPDFPIMLRFNNKDGWYAVTEDGEVLPADIPDGLKRPPYGEGTKKPKKPFTEDGVDIKGWKVPSLPYLVWAPIEKKPAEKQIIRALKTLAKKSDEVIIATDFDREGELIGSDALNQVKLECPDIPSSRARYSAYTKAEIDHAFSNLVPLDNNLADSGESRQFIDLIWGAVLTRYLTMARFGGFGKVRSAGRVQTPTLALVVERERERNAFVPKPYWVISAMASKATESFKVVHLTNRFWDEKEARDVFNKVKDAKRATVTSVEKKSRKQSAPTPFNTTSLQAAAASEGIAPGRCMRLAESLYMDGLISYPRVDNTVYPKSLNLAEIVKMLSKNPAYAPVCAGIIAKGDIKATRGKQESTDHPPIYPTGVANEAKLDPAAYKLYNLIARRFLATLMDSATIEGTKVNLDVDGETFVGSGDVLTYAGFRAIYPYGLKKDEILPELKEGDTLSISDMCFDAKETEPPARYSQGKLIQEMEKRGLGTKSTRASIIDRLFQVNYLKNNPVEPSKLGIAIIDALESFAPTITSAEMTSTLEKDMNEVSEGDMSENSVVDSSRSLLAGIMDVLIDKKDALGDAIADAVTADAKVGTCPKCGGDLVMKTSAKNRSSFVGCMSWPTCDVTYPVPNGRISPLEGDAAVCSECGAPRVKVQPFRSKAYEVCINPSCPSNKEEDVVVGTCSKCKEEGRSGKLIAHRSEKTGKRFIRCENYDICGVGYPLPARGKLHATGEVCSECGSPMVEIDSERGPWKFCVNMECPSKQKRGSTFSRRKKTK